MNRVVRKPYREAIHHTLFSVTLLLCGAYLSPQVLLVINKQLTQKIKPYALHTVIC